MNFNRKKFFDGFRADIDDSIEQEQVEGLDFLLRRIEADSLWKDVRHIAYALATVYHETAGSFQPVEEGYYLGSSAKVKRFQKALRYFPYFGRGYVQTTWKKNYERVDKAFGTDTVNHPELALDPNIAYKTLSAGMHQGWFTGKKLTDYIKAQFCDYKNARRIINGTDKAALIAGYAKQFEKILRDSTAVHPSESNQTVEPKGQAEAVASTSAVEQTANSEQPPNITETKITEVQEQDGKTVAQETTATAPKGDEPDVPPVKVTKNGPVSAWLFSGGGLASVGTLLFGFIQQNLNVIAVAIVCLTLLIVVLIFRKALTDAIRMQTAADTDKRNVT